MAWSKQRKLLIGGGVIGLFEIVGLLLALRDDEDGPDLPLSPIPAKPGGPGLKPIPAFPTAPPEFPVEPIPARPKDPKRVVDDYLGPGTRTKTLYQIKRGDYPAGVARKALDGDPRSAQKINRGHPALDDYILLMTAVIMNVNTYGVLWTTDKTHGRPKYETIEDEDGERYTIHYAYLPKNYDNLERLRRGEYPRRAYPTSGVGGIVGGSYGVIWLPDAYVTGAGKLFVVDDDLPPELRGLMPKDWYA